MIAEKRAAIKIKQLINDWKGRGDEKQDTQSFLSLLRTIYDVDCSATFIEFEGFV